MKHDCRRFENYLIKKQFRTKCESGTNHIWKRYKPYLLGWMTRLESAHWDSHDKFGYGLLRGKNDLVSFACCVNVAQDTSVFFAPYHAIRRFRRPYYGPELVVSPLGGPDCLDLVSISSSHGTRDKVHPGQVNSPSLCSVCQYLVPTEFASAVKIRYCGLKNSLHYFCFLLFKFHSVHLSLFSVEPHLA